MAFIRVIHPKHYDPRKKRFQSPAFKPSKANKISVFEEECAIQASGSKCAHIRKFYPTVTGEPPIFWEVPSSTFGKQGCHCEQIISDTGDPCHHNIMGIPEKEARRIIISVPTHEFMLCDSQGIRPLQESDLPCDFDPL